MKIILFIAISILFVSCNSSKKKADARIEKGAVQEKAMQIGEYVVETFQDSKGNLWFGTLEQGVGKQFDDQFIYLTMKDGLPSNRVSTMLEDATGNLWFGTDVGISKYNGKTFTNYSEKDGLRSNMISTLFQDSKGTFWIGTWGGVCVFDGKRFENFEIPYPPMETQLNSDTKDWITEITEDSKGNIWFGRDGCGAAKFDGKTFVHFTKKEGLNSNNVHAITEDQDGNIWMGTRVGEKDNPDPNKRSGTGGLNKYDGKKMTHFTEIKGLSENDVYTIYKDKTNNLWFSTTSNGVYKYANETFVHYPVTMATMGFLQDKKGNMWLGCAGGLNRINSKGEIQNITTQGPWD